MDGDRQADRHPERLNVAGSAIRRCELRARRKLLRKPELELPVDQDECDHGRRVRPVAPGVVGAALDQDVAGLQHHVFVVEQHRDLAREHDRVVDGLGAVHARMTAALAEGRRLLVAQRREGAARLLDAHAADRFGLRREMIDAQHRRVLGRQLAARAERRFNWRGGDQGRRAVGAPDVGRLPSREQRIDVNERRRAVGDDNRPAVLIVPGHNAADRAGHGCSPSCMCFIGVRR